MTQQTEAQPIINNKCTRMDNEKREVKENTETNYKREQVMLSDTTAK